MVGGEDEARPLGEIPQHLEVALFETQPVAPGQVESQVEDLDGPDHPSPGLAGRKVGFSDMASLFLNCWNTPIDDLPVT